MNSFELLSVRLFVEWAASTKLVPAENCDDARHSEPKELIAFGAAREERSSDGDRQGKGSDAATQKQQQREQVRGLLVHGVLLLDSFEIEAQSALVAAGLGLEVSIGQPLNLELAFVGRELAPSAYTALVNAERSSDGGLGAVVADHIRGLHET